MLPLIDDVFGSKRRAVDLEFRTQPTQPPEQIEE